MTQQDIIEMMSAPEQIAPSRIPELYEFLREYPYSQTFRALYLKALCNAEDFRYDAECGIAAIYAGDREVLSELMSKKYVHVEKKEENSREVAEKNREKEALDPHCRIAPMTDIISELEKMEPKIQTTGKKGNKKHDGLIDDFLKKSEKGSVAISVPKVGDNQSVEDKTKGQGGDQFYTETLAKIYIKQEKYEQAVKIFRRLMVKNSEKSVYFADQVRFLEKLMDNL